MKQHTLRILCFGEIVWEKFNDTHTLGGPSYLLAAHCAGMGNVSLLYGRIGVVPAGEKALRVITGSGIDASCVQLDSSRPTATASVSEEFYSLDSGAHSEISADFSTLEKVTSEPFDALCFDSLIQMYSGSAAALVEMLNRLETREVLYDFNLRGRFFCKKIFESSLKAATIVRCNEEEVRTISTILFGKILRPQQFGETISRTYFVPLVIVRLKSGAAALYHAGEYEEIAAPYDCAPSGMRGTGAAFNAAFLSAFLNGRSRPDSVRAAISAASCAASQNSRIPNYPESVLSLLHP